MSKTPAGNGERIRWTHKELEVLFRGRRWLTDVSQDAQEQVRRWQLAQMCLPRGRRREKASLKAHVYGASGKEAILRLWREACERDPSIENAPQLDLHAPISDRPTHKEVEDIAMLANRYQPQPEPQRLPAPQGIGRARHDELMDDELAQRDRASAIRKLMKRVGNYRYRGNRFARENGKRSPMYDQELERAEAKLALLRAGPLAKESDETLAKAALATQRVPTNKKKIRWGDEQMARIAFDDEVRLAVQHYELDYSLARLAVALREAQERQLRAELHKDEEAVYSWCRRRAGIHKLREVLATTKRPRNVRATPSERLSLIEKSIIAMNRGQSMLEPYAEEVNRMRVKGQYWERLWAGELKEGEVMPPENTAILMSRPLAKHETQQDGEHVTGRKLTIINAGIGATTAPPIAPKNAVVPATTSAQLAFSAQLAKTINAMAPAPAVPAAPASPATLGQHIGAIIDQSIAATVEGVAKGIQQAMSAQIEAMQTQMAQQFQERIDAALTARMGDVRSTVAGAVGANMLKLDDIRAMLVEVVGGPSTPPEPEKKPEKKPEATPIEVQPARAPRVAVFGLHGNNATIVKNEIGDALDLRFYDLDHLNDMPRDGTPAVLAMKFIPHTLRYKLQGMKCPLVYAQGGAGSVIAALRTMAQERTVTNGAMQ